MRLFGLLLGFSFDGREYYFWSSGGNGVDDGADGSGNTCDLGVGSSSDGDWAEWGSLLIAETPWLVTHFERETAGVFGLQMEITTLTNDDLEISICVGGSRVNQW